MDASEIYSKRLNAKEVTLLKEMEIHFPAVDGGIKLSGGDQELRTPTLIREHPIQGESRRNFLGEWEWSLPPSPHDSLPDASEAINDFWSMSGNFIYRHHVEPRAKLYSPREESFPIPLDTLTYPELHIQTWTLSKKAASMIIEVSMGQEICLVLRQVSLSLLYLVRNLQTDICGPERDWQNCR